LEARCPCLEVDHAIAGELEVYDGEEAAYDHLPAQLYVGVLEDGKEHAAELQQSAHNGGVPAGVEDGAQHEGERHSAHRKLQVDEEHSEEVAVHVDELGHLPGHDEGLQQRDEEALEEETGVVGEGLHAHHGHALALLELLVLHQRGHHGDDTGAVGDGQQEVQQHGEGQQQVAALGFGGHGREAERLALAGGRSYVLVDDEVVHLGLQGGIAGRNLHFV
jgi:hypothetical protein